MLTPSLSTTKIELNMIRTTIGILIASERLSRGRSAGEDEAGAAIMLKPGEDVAHGARKSHGGWNG